MTGLFLILSVVVTLACHFWFKPPTLLASGGLGIGSLLAVFLACQAAMYVSTSSTEILNGQVTGKEQNTVSCSHSYQCNCRTVTTGSGQNQTTTTVCDTCYEHSHDYDWDVYTTVGTFTIDRVDRQGVDEPQRWSIVRNGDPVSTTHTYTNWIKPAGSSLFNVSHIDLTQYKDKLPKYPGRIYDYYKIDRIVSDYKIPNIDSYEHYLSEQLETLGPKRQANMIFVITKNLNPTYADAVYASWNGAEKNDIVVFLGVAQNGEIKWASVKAWSKFDIFQVTLRDALLDLKTFDMKKVIDTSVSISYSKFERKPMKEFEYLSNEVQTITPVAGVIIAIFMLVINIGGMIIIIRQLENNGSYRYRY
ncbi:MAG: hypothetical protein M0R77_02805 [Gammaproteobacteria bacterium]|nr:hypothetical protein [Gammaproteobacteria bacterium]